MNLQKHLLIILTACCLGCNNHYYKFLSHLPNNNTAKECIHIDESYDYYIRQLYKTSGDDKKTLKNFSNKKDQDSLIEIEYLFVSKQKRNVIYISTVPDKFQKYYKNPHTYLGETFVNVYDFKKFSFGIINDNNDFQFVTKNKKNKDVWNVYYKKSASDSFITINRVEQTVNNQFVDLIPVNRALENDISFKKVTQPYLMLFYRNDNLKDSAVCSDHNICYNKYKEKYEVELHFDNDIDGNHRTIFFTNNRIAYNPYLLHK